MANTKFDRSVAEGLDLTDAWNDVVEGAASALWTTAWAAAWEEARDRGEVDELPWGQGDDIADAAPSPGPEAYPSALAILFEFVHRAQELDTTGTLSSDDGEALGQLYMAALKSKYDAPEDPEEFGWQMAMAWLGNGTGTPDLSIGGKRFGQVVGHGEFALSLDTDVDDEGDFTISLQYTSAQVPKA